MKKKENLLVSFLNGNVSFVISFWIFGFLGLILAGIICAIIFRDMLLVRLFTYPYLIYVSFGVWRSASKYQGKKFLSILGKIFIVLWNINQFLGLLVSTMNIR